MRPPFTPKILSVDDRDDVRYLRARVLQAAGFAVRDAATGAEALASAQAEAPDVVVLDVTLPDLGGLEVCRALKADPRTSSALVLLISAVAIDQQCRVEGLESGADAYLTASAEPAELVATIRALLRSRDVERRVRESERLFRSLFDAAPVLITAVDGDGRILLFNPACEEATGYSREEILGQPLVPLLIPEAWRDDVASRVASAAEEDLTASLLHPWRTKAGGERLIEWRYVRWSRLAGESLLFAVGIDFTERRQAEEAREQLRTRTEREQQRADALAREADRRAAEAETGAQVLAALMDHIPEGITIADAPDVRIRMVSRYGQAMTGRDRVMLEGIPVGQHATAWRVFHADGVTPARNDELPLTRATVRGETVEDEEWVLERADGSRATVLCNAGPIRDAEGSIVGGVIAWRDISERKRIAKDLEVSNARLRLLAETAGALLLADRPHEVVDAIFRRVAELVDVEVCFHYLVDPAGEALQLAAYGGVSDETAKAIDRLEFGQAVCGTVALEQHPIVLDRVDESTDPRTDLVRALGLRAYACHPLVFQGRMVGTLSFGTSRRSRFTPDEVSLMRALSDQLAAALERRRLLDQLETANRAKDEFLMTVSHELRTPLQAILGWARVLQGGQDNASVQRASAVITRNARAQAELVDDLLDMARILSGRLVVDAREIDVIPVVEAALDAVRPAAEAKDVRLRWTAPREMARVYGDAARLQQIVWNLLSNAVKFTPAGGRIDVTVGRRRDDIAIVVADTGQGISPDFLPHIFDRFRQADASTTRRYMGLGLGLAIVRHLVELHGGTVDAASPGQGHGSTFTVKLPIRRVAAAQSVRAVDESIDRAPPTDCGLSLDGIRVVLVDDEADTRDVLALMLRERGAAVTVAASASEVLRAVGEGDIDVLVADVGMPVTDGYGLIRELRSREAGHERHLPAIALTAYVGPANRERALAAGFDAHVPKPVEPLELVALVAQLVLGPPSSSSTTGPRP